MPLESSHNFFYRYVISESEPFSFTSHQRKIAKARQHSTTALLVDLVSCQNLTLALKSFSLNSLREKNPFSVHILLRPDQYLQFLAEDEVADFQTYFFIETQTDYQTWLQLKIESTLLLCPGTTPDLKFLSTQFLNIESPHFWTFKPYKPSTRHSVSLKDIYQTQKIHNQKYRTLPGLELWNTNIPSHYELEPLVQKSWSFETSKKSLQISVIIPSFNNVTFLANVLRHLIHQSLPTEYYEIIVVEDGGLDHTAELLHSLFENFKGKVNLKMIYWPKKHTDRGDQTFFRAGLSRNLAMQFCESEKAVFLDSDMLVPPDFLKIAIAELEKSDVIQFQRYHIHQNISRRNPDYSSIRLQSDTYIEEKGYWNQLFKSDHWMSLPDYWKFTCTYALGLRRSDFFKVGRFKKYYVSYGFEDTDLGYEFFKRGSRFKLVKTPLFHLTAYDRMQYKNSQFQRLKLLRKTAALFYLQHLDPQIYELFGNFYRFEKSIYQTLRDFF